MSVRCIVCACVLRNRAGRLTWGQCQYPESDDEAQLIRGLKYRSWAFCHFQTHSIEEIERRCALKFKGYKGVGS